MLFLAYCIYQVSRTDTTFRYLCFVLLAWPMAMTRNRFSSFQLCTLLAVIASQPCVILHSLFFVINSSGTCLYFFFVGWTESFRCADISSQIYGKKTNSVIQPSKCLKSTFLLWVSRPTTDGQQSATNFQDEENLSRANQRKGKESLREANNGVSWYEWASLTMSIQLTFPFIISDPTDTNYPKQ